MENNYGDYKDYSHVVKHKNKQDLTTTNFILCLPPFATVYQFSHF